MVVPGSRQEPKEEEEEEREAKECSGCVPQQICRAVCVKTNNLHKRDNDGGHRRISFAATILLSWRRICSGLIHLKATIIYQATKQF